MIDIGYHSVHGRIGKGHNRRATNKGAPAMPMITIRYVTPQPRPELRPKLAELARRLGSEVLGKDPGVTAVLVEPADPESWFIAGKRPTEAGLSAFWLDFKATAN